MRIVVVLLISLAATCLPYCVVTAKKPSPPSQDCDGSPIEVLNEDICGISKWMQVADSSTVCEILCHQSSGGKKGKPSTPDCELLMICWIGGTVVAHPAAENGFYFEPGTVRVAEVTAEGMQTTICQISLNPDFYDGGLWYVGAFLSDINEL
jgi:hypothetical protein